MQRSLSPCIWFVFLGAVLLAPNVRAESECAECHRGLFTRQSATRHAHALSPFAGSKVAASLQAMVDHDDGAYSYKYQGSSVTVSDSSHIAKATLAWAFGAGAQGMTPVGFLNGSYFEHRFSWYRTLDRPALSPGHPQPIPSMYFALGLFSSPADAVRCFDCHATGVREDQSGNPDLTAMTPGITCERCHGPGRDHTAAVRAGKPAVVIRHAIFNSGRLAPKASIEVCGGCHRSPISGSPLAEPEKVDPLSVRFQPLGLLASKCFRVSGRLSCLVCHDPHSDAVCDARYYVAKCVECHPARALDDVAAHAPTRCGRNEKQDCLPCHMPTTHPLANLTFTDHRIRIYSNQ